MCVCDNEEEKDMAKMLSSETYKKLSLDPKTIKDISVTPKVRDGKMLFDKNNKNHRHIVEDD